MKEFYEYLTLKLLVDSGLLNNGSTVLTEESNKEPDFIQGLLGDVLKQAGPALISNGIEAVKNIVSPSKRELPRAIPRRKLSKQDIEDID